MDPQTQKSWLPRVQNVDKGGVVSDLALAVGGVIEEEEEEVLVIPSGKDMNSSRAQHNNVKENRKNGVTSSDDDRITFYALATIIVINSLVVSILVLWFDILPDAGTFHKLLYVLLAAATIPYIGVLFICLCNDVPVPSYRLGAERRFGIYVATMVVIYCISYGVKDIDVMIEMSVLVTTSITGAIAIVQLHSPAEDFDPGQTAFLVLLAMLSSVLGGVAQESWTALFGTLYYFISAISLVNSHCLAADLSEQQRRERQRQRRQQPLLPVSSSSSSIPPCAFLL